MMILRGNWNGTEVIAMTPEQFDRLAAVVRAAVDYDENVQMRWDELKWTLAALTPDDIEAVQGEV